MKSIKVFFIGLLLVLSNSSLFGTTEQVEDFVTRFYQKVLNREPDTAGLQDWTNQLVSGTKSGADIAKGFIFSAEFTNRNTSNSDYLTILYQAFFNRDPDTSGFNSWIDKLDKGTSRESVLDGFLNSLEFSNLCADYGISPTTTNSSNLNNTDLETIFKGVVFDDYIKGAKVCIDMNENESCDEGEPFTKTNDNGRFIFDKAYNVCLKNHSLIVEGGIDIGTKKPFIGSFSTPSGSPVISPLTTIIHTMVKEGKSKKEANRILQEKLGLPKNIEVTKFDPMFILEHSKDTSLKENSRVILSKQTEIQTIVKVNAKAIRAVDNNSSLKRISRTIIRNLSQKILSTPNSQKMDINSSVISKILLNSAKNIYQDSSKLNRIKSVANEISLKIEETVKKAKKEILKAPANLEAIKTSNAILVTIDDEVAEKVEESVKNEDIETINNIKIDEIYNNQLMNIDTRPTTSNDNPF